MPITADDVKAIVEEMLGSYLSDKLVDGGYVNREAMEFLLNHKVDSRNIVDYTFSGTSSESFEHQLGRIPVGAIILNQTQNARIYGDITTWTIKRVTLTSSVANNQVRFLFL